LGNNAATFDGKSSSITGSIATNGFVKHLRAEYLLALSSNKCIDTTLSNCNLNPILDSAVFNGVYPAIYNTKKPVPYNVTLPLTLTVQKATATDAYTTQTIPNTPNFQGFSSLLSPLLGKGCF
jgi:hypothetical protein